MMKYGDAGSSYNHLIFGQTAILVSVYWGGHERGNGPRSRQEVHDSLAVVLIDRKSGKSTEVPGLPVGINYGSGGAGDTILLATAVGDSFFALASPETKENFDDDSIPPCLWQIKPDGTVKMLTKPGRRPELTPFDAIDRSAITALRHDGGRLLVSSRDNHHYYDPKKETWEAAPPWNKFWKYVGDLDRADLHSSIFPHHILKMNDGGKDVYFDSQSTKSGRLACTRNGGPMLEFPLLCNIPEDYPATFGIGGKSVDGVREAIALKDLIAQGKFHIMILNQTDTYFILGMSFEGVRHAYQTCVVRGLPFVWMVDKEKIRQAIKTAEETGK